MAQTPLPDLACGHATEAKATTRTGDNKRRRGTASIIRPFVRAGRTAPADVVVPHGTARVSKRMLAPGESSVRLAYARGSVMSRQRLACSVNAFKYSRLHGEQDLKNKQTAMDLDDMVRTIYSKHFAR